MSNGNVVKKLGRVEYIEPNNLFTNSTGDKIQNGIPQPYEDYSFSVHLRVVTGNRYDCGSPNTSENTLDFSSDNGTLSFMDGTSVNGQQGYLTTNFTDISMNNPDTNTKECLGIEHISIKYDSWFYPTVDIRFVDVRGASLMQPAEYEYYNNGNPNKQVEKTQSSNFFKAFFSFPYPLFRLSVKGFYGKVITYDLSVLKCNIEFNSSTGNFEANASFIGYMYGMYGDLPFSFVYLAPYIDKYGMNTWEEKRKTGDFCYLTTDTENPVGPAMYTFPELKRAIEDATKVARKVISTTPDGEKMIETKKLFEKLEKEVLPACPTKASLGSWWPWSEIDTKEEKKGFFYLALENTTDNNRKIFNDILKFQTLFNEYNELTNSTKYYKGQVLKTRATFENIYLDAKAKTSGKNKTKDVELTEKEKELIAHEADAIGVDVDALIEQRKIEKQIKAQYEGIISTEYTDSDIEKILESRVVTIAFHKDDKDKDNPKLVYDATESKYGSADESKYMPLIDELKKRFSEENITSPMHKSHSQTKWTIRAFEIENIDYRNSINDTISSLKKDYDALKTKMDSLRDETIEDIIGFVPSMKNLYNMVFAHVDTFMTAFYNTLDEIRASIQSNDDSRSYDNLCGGGIQVDVNDNTLKNNSVSGGKLPPFTMFYKEETKKDSEDKEIVMKWPGSLPGGENLPEVKLVESIVNATALNKKRYEPLTPKNNIIKREGKIAPINYYDLISEENPYVSFLNKDTISNESIVKLIIRTFILRCFYSMLSGSYVGPEPGAENNGLSSSVANYTKKAKLIAELEIGNIERALELNKMNPNENFLLELLKTASNGSDIMSEYTGGNKPMFQLNDKNKTVKYSWIKDGDNYRLPVGTFSIPTIENYVNGAELNKDSDKCIKIGDNGTLANGEYTCKIYSGGNGIEQILGKNGSGDFVMSSRLFPNYKTVPSQLSGITFQKGMFNDATIADLHGIIGNEFSLTGYPATPSIRKTSAGVTSVFMDPLYYAQKSTEARAYMFLMGVPYGKNDEVILPGKVENGDYPTLMLLREGAFYWRKKEMETADPINYVYNVNGVEVNALLDIELNDPKFGVNILNKEISNESIGRRDTLIKYFKKWACGVNDEMPGIQFKIDFQTIERYLALWAQKTVDGVTIDIILPYESCDWPVIYSGVTRYSNYNILNTIYNVSKTTGELGKFVQDKIRTEVKIKQIVLDENAKNFLDAFKKFYIGFDTFIDFSCLDNPSSNLSVPVTAMNDAISSFVKGLKTKYKVSPEAIKEIYRENSAGKPAETPPKPQEFKSDDIKLACYISLKNMYDRWLCSTRRERWRFSCDPRKAQQNKSDFLRFYYIDEFYHDNSMLIKPNLTNFIENVCKLGGFTEKSNAENLASVSLMKILSTTAQYGGCSLITLPTQLGLAKTYADDRNNIGDVFKAFTYNESVVGEDLETSFIVLYSNQKSSMLDVPDDKGTMGYKSDGFDLANTWGEIVPQPMFSDSDENGFVVPCFGVTFAKQNQSYFKDIRLSMEDHQETEFSIRNQVMISYQSNTGPRETSVVGQDLYNVYSNYSYSCNVTMMGDAQITPLMYFQLNNIAMWKGAYMITNVHHEISVEGMETVFTGVRQARPALPIKGDELDVPAGDAAGQTPQSQDSTEVLTVSYEFNVNISKKPLDKINVDNVNYVVFALDRSSVNSGSDTSTLKTLNGVLTARIYYTNGPEFPEVIEVAKTIENTNTNKENERKSIQNFVVNNAEKYFSLPKGRYERIEIENPPTGLEYRNVGDEFYDFTDGKHIFVTNSVLGGKFAEFIPGDSNLKEFSADDLLNMCFGDASPIILYSDTDRKEANRSIYQEVFDFVKRMNEAKKPLTMLITEPDDILDKKVK